MEDRKRSIVADVDDSAPPAKRQAVNGVKPHPDADMPWKDELETFQKDAILRQMKEYKREKETFEARLKDMEERRQYHDDHLRILDSWLSQFADQLRILCTDFVSDKAPVDPSTMPLPTALLSAESEAFQKHLASRTEAIESVMSQVLDKIPPAAPEIRDLQGQLARQLAVEKEHIRQAHELMTEKERLSERLENASYRYMLAEKKLDRAKSAAVAKLEAQAIQHSVPANDEGSKGKSEDTAMVNGIPEESADRGTLETSRNEALLAAAKRKEQLTQLESENAKLIEQITALNVKFASLTDDDYAKTNLFKQFRSQHEEVVKKLNDLEAVNAKLREETQKLRSERTTFRLAADEELRNALGEAESQLARAENDVSRIRSARDEHAAQLAIERNTHATFKQTAVQLRELASASESRITALESEVQRLRIRLGEEQVEPTEGLEDLSAEQLRAKVASLDNELKMLNSELPAMEAAFKKTQALSSKKVADMGALEEKLTMVSADREKATQKYYAAMKSKDAREAENRTLRGQNTKSSEIISQLKETISNMDAFNKKLDQNLAQHKELLTNEIQQNRMLQQKIVDHGFATETLTTQTAELRKVLVAKDAEVIASGKAQREAEVKAEQLGAQLEDSKKRIESLKKSAMGKGGNPDEGLRTLLYCHCKENVKNVVLKPCGHTMCKNCAQERIQSRSRQCPRCSKPYGKADIMDITLA